MITPPDDFEFTPPTDEEFLNPSGKEDERLLKLIAEHNKKHGIVEEDDIEEVDDLPEDVESEELFMSDIEKDFPFEPDYGIITDAFGPQDTEEEWGAAIGKPPPLEEDE